ncbi:MAG: hypothetical protein LBH59_02020 [Planctomycetaceae bacterium]|nr:hypothetical protein [Planctomycetaceae bacterium]
MVSVFELHAVIEIAKYHMTIWVIMTTILNTLVSSDYQVSPIVKSSLVASQSRIVDSKAEPTVSVASDSYIDTLTISKEALEANESWNLEKLRKQMYTMENESAEEKMIRQLNQRNDGKSYWYDAIERKFTYADIPFGKNKFDPVTKTYSTTLPTLADFAKLKEKSYVCWKNCIERIDDKIATVLKENGLDLNENEILNFSVDQNGRIKIDNGIEEDKRKILEKVFNEDKEFSADLLDSHCSLQASDSFFGTSATTSHVDNTGLAQQNTYLLRKYGFSEGDLEITSEDEKLSGALPLKFKDGSSDNELLMKMFTEDASIFDVMVQHLTNSSESIPSEFAYNFSYKNGVTIEAEQGNQSGLNERYKTLLRESPSFVPENNDKISFSLIIDSNGEIVDSIITDMNKKSDTETNTILNSKEFGLYIDTLKNNMQKSNNENVTGFQFLNSKSRFQQYVFESQRLFRFNTGLNKEDAEQLNVTLDRTYTVKRKRKFVTKIWLLIR